jgi:hypothetical protein
MPVKTANQEGTMAEGKPILSPLITWLVAFGILVSAATPTSAMKFSDFHATFSQVLKACSDAKGTLTEDSADNSYGCHKDNCDGKGGDCTVYCTNKGNCTGATPGRLSKAITLRGLLQNGDMVNHSYDGGPPATSNTPDSNSAPPDTNSMPPSPVLL